MRTRIAWVAMLAATAVSGCNSASDSSQSAPPAAATNETAHSAAAITEVSNTMANARQFSVEGMSCDGCVSAVTGKLKSVPGVESVKVSLADKKAEVVADPAKVPDDKIVAAVTEAGYTAKPLAAP